jgi:endonuclease III related protein
MERAIEMRALYRRLFREYGPRGWWPIVGKAGKPGFDVGGYHPGDYASPRTARDKLSVCLGAILTQNTAWRNAERALISLDEAGVLDPETLAKMDQEALSALIRSSGYYRQKARKIQEFARTSLEGAWFTRRNPPERGELLSVWGIGKETADSMLLYAFRRLEFVIDAYTLRVLGRRGLIDEGTGYDEAREFLTSALPPDIDAYNECHALLVELAKGPCLKVPDCHSCPVADDCRYSGPGL